MNEKQHNALRLAEMNEKSGRWESAAELRRLHEVNVELMDALQAILNVDSSYQWAGCSDQELAAIEKAEAAIAKATGE